MREAVYISNVSRMRDIFPMLPACALASEALKTPSKLRCTFGHFHQFVFFIFGSPWIYGSMVPHWGHGVIFVAYCLTCNSRLKFEHEK